MEKPEKEISIIVVNYNGLIYLNDCFTSINNLNYPKEKIEVIMVDNKSGDKSTEYVEKKFPWIWVLKNDANNYCRACNLGIKNANSKFIIFLNNDMYVDKNWLNELLSVIKEDKKIGAVGGKILFLNGKIQSTGHIMFSNLSWKDRGFMEKDTKQYNQIEQMESLCGGAILYRRECLKDIGPFDERFHMYYEDVDMALRCKKKGWKLLYVPKAIAYHKFRGTATDEFVSLQSRKNSILVVAKHFPERLNEFANDIARELVCKDKAIKFGKEGIKSLTAQLQDIFNSRTWKFLKKVDKISGAIRTLKVLLRKTLVRQNRGDF